MTYAKLLLDAVTKKYFRFRGRASRKEYFAFTISNLLLDFIITIFYFVFKKNIPWLAFITYSIQAFLFIPGITVTVRRLHDINLSGWWWFISLVFGTITYFVNRQRFLIFEIFFIIFFLVIMSIKGTNGPNKYGEQP